MAAAAHARLTADEVRRWLDRVPDPEIPVLSVNDLGIVREIVVEPDGVAVSVTPTWSACPATEVIEREIAAEIRRHGVANVTVRRALSPPWTTDRISGAGLAKLEAFGIAPPVRGRSIRCPRCGSAETAAVSAFGSTPCKAAYRCDACLEPFEAFKCL